MKPASLNKWAFPKMLQISGLGEWASCSFPPASYLPERLHGARHSRTLVEYRSSQFLPTNTTTPKGQAAKNTPLCGAMFVLPVIISPHPQFLPFKL